MIKCPSCGMQNEAGAAFCDNCGTALSMAPPPQRSAAPSGLPPTAAAGGLTCPQCGQPVMPGEAFCDNCGAALSGMTAPPPPAQQPAPPPYQPAPPPYQPQPAAPPAGAIRCPTCGTMATPGAAFCDNCGVSLSSLSGTPPAPPQWQPQQPPQQWPQPQPPQQWQPPAPQQWQPQAPVQAGPPPRLVIQGSNASLPFPAGKAEIIAGREDPVSNVFPEVNLDPYGGDEGGISRRHAKFTLQGSQWYVQDLNSTNFTFVNKQKLQPNQPHPVNHGDEVRLGRIIMNFFTS